MRAYKLLAIIGILFLAGCGTGSTLSVEEMLEFANLESVPPAENYQEYGAVILYENTHTQFLLNSNWEVVRKQRYHMAAVYYNDKAEHILTKSIYLDDSRALTEFNARTIKPDGTIIELTSDDLIRTQLKEEYVEFSDDESVKFTFAGVEPGAILEVSYEVSIFDSFDLNDRWFLQSSLPKLYVRYSVQIPTIYLRYNFNWNYSAMNFELPRPEVQGDLVNQQSRKDQNNTYFWEIRNVEALEYEPDMPPYDDIAKYVTLGIQRDNWNELTQIYWSIIQDRFDSNNNPEIKRLAKSIVGDASTELEKIEKIYNYTQQNFRYVAISIGESGYTPHFYSDIINKKYGDCKDMTVLNVVMLKALGIDAYPALVKTKGEGNVYPHVIDLDFNHMVAMVKSEDGNTYWLDATGSSCPVDEIYSSIEGTKALVLKEDGNSYFTDIPESKSRDNLLSREITINVKPDGNIEGHAKLILKGNQNLAFRSSFKDATESDMKKMVESYINSNTPDVEISNITYDNPAEIKKDISIEFDYKTDGYGIISNDLVLINPFIFSIDSDLDRYRDEKRNYPVVFDAPYEYYDEIKVIFPDDKLEFASKDKNLKEEFPFGKVTSYSRQKGNEVTFERRVAMDATYIGNSEYPTFRDYLKSINKANRNNLALKIK